MFQKVEPADKMLDLQKKLETEDFVDLRIKELEEELESTKEHLQIFTEELEATNEELQTINEELQSANEELKSSNEELETSNEELNTAIHEMRLANESLIAKEKELKEEKAISESNERIYRTIAENIPNGSVGILNQNFEIEYMAGKIFETGPTEPKDLIGKSMSNLNPSKKEAERLRKLCQATLKGKSGQIEVFYEDRYYVVQMAPITISEEEGTKILYLAQEITELRRNQMKLETALEATNLIVFECDFEKDRILPNKALRKFLEISGNKALSQADIVDKIHPEDVEKREKNMKKALETGRIDYEVRLQLEDEAKHIRVLGKIGFDEDKKPLRGIATLQDITHDKELLHQVKSSEERFKLIADSAPVSIWITDKNDQCTYINQAWLEYTGSSLEDCLNDGWFKYIHPEDQRRAMQTFLTASDEREPFELEYMVEDKDGNYGWFLNRAHPMFDKNDRFVGYIGSNVDITEQKEFSKALEKKVAERTEELEQANAELVKLNMNLEEYAYVASHDLQEPVRKIRMFNSMLLDNSDTAEAVEKYSRKIESSAERMTNLIKSVLDYSKLIDDSLTKETVDLDEVLQEIRNELELLVKEEKVKIIGENLGTVPGGRIHIFQLLSNLIRNAVKFNEQQPEIRITAAEIEGKSIKSEFPSTANRTYKKLTLSDNGIGIAENELKDIFKPFKRLNSKNEYSGTGIGLAICQRIIELHSGHIGVESEKGKGTIFFIYLPLEPKE
jgi:PAS domain S-box-containing protein